MTENTKNIINLDDRISEAIPDILYFGSFPRKHEMQLFRLRFTWFVDLTCDDEKNITKYNHLVYNYINYPIKDHDFPRNWNRFCIFIQIINVLIKRKEVIYIHCRGGHGRSMIVVCILLYFYNRLYKKSIFKIIKDVWKYHNNRKTTQPYHSIPVNSKQLWFIINFCNNKNIIK